MEYQALNGLIVVVLVAFGISIQPGEFFAGVLAAIFGAAFLNNWRPTNDQRKTRLIISTAVFASFCAGGAHPIVAPTWPPALFITLCGSVSSFFVQLLMRAFYSFLGRTDRIADGLVEKAFGKSGNRKDEEG